MSNPNNVKLPNGIEYRVDYLKTEVLVTRVYIMDEMLDVGWKCEVWESVAEAVQYLAAKPASAGKGTMTAKKKDVTTEQLMKFLAEMPKEEGTVIILRTGKDGRVIGADVFVLNDPTPLSEFDDVIMDDAS